MGLRDIRLNRGLTLKALAEKSGVHYIKIQQIETGKIRAENITLRNALRLAQALDCKPEDLLSE